MDVYIANRSTRVGRALATLVAALGAAAAGCTEDPFAEFRRFDPFARKEWAEELKYGAMYGRLEDLRSLRGRASVMSAEQKQAAARRLYEAYQAEKHPVLRGETAIVIGLLGGPDAEQCLRLASRDPEPPVRMAACRGWRSLGGPGSMQALGEMLNSDTELDVRLAAARAMDGFSGSETERQAAVQALAAALEDRNPALQFRAMESMKTLSGRDYGHDVRAWQEYARGADPTPPPAPSIARQLQSWF